MLACFAAFAQMSVAAAGEPEPAPGSAVDIAAVRDKLVFASDGKGHTIAAVPFAEDRWSHVYWSADGKVFSALRITGGSAVGTEKFDKVFWEPRVAARWQGGLGLDGNQWWVQCFDRKTNLQVVDGDNRTKLLAAQFVAPTWDRQAYALARDDTGTYYFVDRGVGEKSKHFRVFIGPRGQLKPRPLVNVVTDSEGDIFATKEGSLRLVLGKSESTWIAGKRQSKLVILPLDENRQMIYRELGPYLGQRLGTPCDDL